MKHFKSGRKFSESVGIDLQVLINTYGEHYQVAQKTFADPEVGSYPGYSKGASWDQISGTTNCTISGKPAGKKFYHNAILGSAVADEEFYVAVGTHSRLHGWNRGRRKKTGCPRKVKRQGTCTGTRQKKLQEEVYFFYM